MDRKSQNPPVTRTNEDMALSRLGVFGGISHSWRALRHRNFRLYFGGQTISLIGTWMTRIATSWLVYRLTGSALLVGHGKLRRPDSNLYLRAIRGRLG